MTSWRTDKRRTAERGYGGTWQRARKAYLAQHPLCARCERQGIVEPATVVHHTVPHRGDPVIFWDRAKWEGLCATHHNAEAQSEERGGVPRRAIGADGWPI